MGQRGSGDGLALDPRGIPSQPLTTVDLDALADATDSKVLAYAEAAKTNAGITIGLVSGTPSAALAPLLDALSLTLAPEDSGLSSRRVVGVPDPTSAAKALHEQVTQAPQAAVALDQLLRQTALLPTFPGLAAEAAVYSLLLGGEEFQSWLHTRPAPRRRNAADRSLVRLQRDDRALQITLSDPERRNAFSFALRDELYAALELALLDDEVEHVVLRGDGAAFCSGGDLAEFGTATDLVAAYLVRVDRGPWRLLEQLRSRATVHLHGAAVGAGLELAAFAGHVSCARDTRLWLPELSMGLVPGAGGTVSITRRVGRWRTAWMALSGEPVDVETALAWGLVDEIDG